MNAALAAHVRILEALPREKVRSHEWRPANVGVGRGRRAELTPELLERYISLKGAGMKYLDMRRELPATSVMMRKLAAAAKEKRRAERRAYHRAYYHEKRKGRIVRKPLTAEQKARKSVLRMALYHRKIEHERALARARYRRKRDGAKR